MIQEFKRYKTTDGREFDNRLDAEVHETRWKLIQYKDVVLGSNDTSIHGFIARVESSFEFENLVSDYISKWSQKRAALSQSGKLVPREVGGQLIDKTDDYEARKDPQRTPPEQ